MNNLIDQLNISLVSLTDTGYTSQMALSSFHAQPQGYLNGGATLAFCEITAGMASNQLGAGTYFAVGQSVNANHLNPKKSEGYVTAQAILLHKGGRSHVWDIKILDETNQLIAQVTVTNALIYKK